MSFNESVRFSKRISAGAMGGPRFSTDTVSNRGGYRKSNQNWQEPLYRYDIARVLQDRDALDEALAFFLAHAGSAHGFRYWDPYDYTHDMVDGTAIVHELTATTHQMRKAYTKGGLTTYRTIRKPVAGTITVLGSGSYSVNSTTGVITTNSGASPTGWTGEFDVPVQFETDLAQLVMLCPDVFSWPSVILEELRNPG
jgi:uncharacterized protein (TIGR02217 family)